MNKKLTLAVGVAVVLVVFGYFAFGGLGSSLVYFWTPTELLAEGEAAYGTSVRLGGMVEPGSVSWDADTQELRFRLADEGGIIEVESAGSSMWRARAYRRRCSWRRRSGRKRSVQW